MAWGGQGACDDLPVISAVRLSPVGLRETPGPKVKHFPRSQAGPEGELSWRGWAVPGPRGNFRSLSKGKREKSYLNLPPPPHCSPSEPSRGGQQSPLGSRAPALGLSRARSSKTGEPLVHILPTPTSSASPRADVLSPRCAWGSGPLDQGQQCWQLNPAEAETSKGVGTVLRSGSSPHPHPSCMGFQNPLTRLPLRACVTTLCPL